MTLKELMDEYCLELSVRSRGVKGLSVNLRGLRFRGPNGEIKSFPGWGNDFESAVSDLISSMRQETHMILTITQGCDEQVLPLPRISGFS